MNIFRKCTSNPCNQGAVTDDEEVANTYSILGEQDNYPVHLNVYDLNRLNNYTGPVGFGVYHTGVEVHGTEYSFGGHPYPITGIFEMDPRSATELGQNFSFKETVLLGHTYLDIESVHEIIQQLGEDFKGYTYHLVHKNCNHFSMAFSRIVCGAEIPTWVNRLASLTACLPFIQRCIPAEWLTPVALAESLRNNPDAIEAANQAAINSVHTNDTLDHLTSDETGNVVDIDDIGALDRNQLGDIAVFDNGTMNGSNGHDSPTLHFITEVNGDEGYEFNSNRRPPLGNDNIDDVAVIQTVEQHSRRLVAIAKGGGGEASDGDSAGSNNNRYQTTTTRGVTAANNNNNNSSGAVNNTCNTNTKTHHVYDPFSTT